MATDLVVHGTIIPNDVDQVAQVEDGFLRTREAFPGRLELQDDGDGVTLHLFAAGEDEAAVSLSLSDQQVAVLRAFGTTPTSLEIVDRIAFARELVQRGVELIEQAHIEAAGGDAWEGWTFDARRLLMLSQKLQQRVVPQVVNEAMSRES